MSLAYWCVLVAGILPYATVGVAKAFGRYDNRNPRAPDSYRGFSLRAHSAHQNGFEAFPLFAIAVIVASHADPRAANVRLDELAGTWLALRLAYTAAYFSDVPALRSAVWLMGLTLSLAIFTMPVWHA